MLGPENDSPELTQLERAVLELAVSGVHDEAHFRQQIEQSGVESRTGSGVGFMTKLDLSADAPAATGVPVLPTIFGEHPDLPEGAEFVLDVRSGRINCIEAFSFEGMWPQDETLFRLRVVA